LLVLLVPVVIVIHGSLLDAVQVQPAPAVTVKVPFPPAVVALALVGERVNMQPDA